MTPIGSQQSFLTLLPKLDFTGRRSVIVAVSGGSDSLALLLLAKAYLERTETRLIAVTIDHGLREASADEAKDVARLCTARAIEHRTLRWTGSKPATGLPAAAREARYRLLAQAADEAGTDVILTGHTRDDQAETIAMRRQRGDGRGLAGMAPATLYDGRIWIARPLLRNRRAELRGFLQGEGVDWIDDPTNQDMAYERARMRAAGIEINDDEIAQAVRARVALSEGVAVLVKKRAVLVSTGLVRLATEFAWDEKPAAIETLRLLLAVMGGVDHLAGAGRTASLFERLGAPLRATLSRSVVDVRRSGIFLYREGRGLPAAKPLRDGMVWDGRFFVSGEGGMLESLGLEHAGAMGSEIGDVPQSLVRSALSAWPAVRNGAGELVPLELQATKEGASATPLLAPWARFLPSFDLAAAASIAELIGSQKIPPCPLPATLPELNRVEA